MTMQLQSEQWTKLLAFLRQHRRAYVGQEAHCRRFLEAVYWIARTGAQWRALPDCYGYWNSVYQRFARWCDHDVWRDMHAHFAEDPDLEWLLLDSSVVRAHPCAAGALKKTAVRLHRH
jgi:transposase